jgi:hypothetical protein
VSLRIPIMIEACTELRWTWPSPRPHVIGGSAAQIAESCVDSATPAG